MGQDWAVKTDNLLTQIRRKKPVVHNITNYVAMQVTANALLAIGASPVMAHAQEEVEEIVKISSALVLNIGTLSNAWIKAMLIALAGAQGKGLPVVIDPVGAGASLLRTTTALSLVTAAAGCVLRGNASEIASLAGGGSLSRGVDSTLAPEAVLEEAMVFSQKYQCVVCVSGAVDCVTFGEKQVFIQGGSALMERVTGMGCTASSIIGAFAAVRGTLPLWEATICAMIFMAAAGEQAAIGAAGPGSFAVRFLDCVYTLEHKHFENVKITAAL